MRKNVTIALSLVCLLALIVGVLGYPIIINFIAPISSVPRPVRSAHLQVLTAKWITSSNSSVIEGLVLAVNNSDSLPHSFLVTIRVYCLSGGGGSLFPPKPYPCAGGGNSTDVLAPRNGQLVPINFDVGVQPSRTPVEKVGFLAEENDTGALGSGTINLPIPFATEPIVIFHLSPPIGSISFNATTYSDGQNGSFTYSSFALVANLPQDYSFIRWNFSGGLLIKRQFSNPTTILVLGSGDLTAIFALIPNVSVTFRIYPEDGGTVSCGNQIFGNNQLGQFRPNATLSCTAYAKSNYRFNRWSNLTSSSANPVTFSVGNGGVLTANFERQSSVIIFPYISLEAAILLFATRLIKRRAHYP